jgi:PmbA protein
LFGSVTREGDVLGIYEYDQSSHINGQIDRWASELGRKLVDAEKIVSLKSGNYKTILMPKVCEILGPIRSALNARAVLKDLSPFADKVGEKIFDERITLFDDGLNTETPGGQPVDDEGVTAQKTTLIENGVLKVFINDLHSASKLGVEPTGNGMRGGLSATPRAGYTTLTLAPGTKTLSELIAEIDHGVIIDQVMGAHQASPFSGDFSVNVDCGFVIEDGKIVGRFKDGMLSGNVFKMFSDQLLDTGSEQRYMGFYMAPVVFDGLTVSTG